MEEYTPDMDQMLFYLLGGSTFKKTYFDETLGRAVSKFVLRRTWLFRMRPRTSKHVPTLRKVGAHVAK